MSRLPRTASLLASGEDMVPLRVTAFGSSTTEGYGSSEPRTRSFPAIAAERLRVALAGGVVLVNRGVSGETIERMAERFDAVRGDDPHLVLLQVGSNDGPQGVPIARFEALLDDGVRRFRADGADVVLIEPQCCPVLEADPRFPPFLLAVRAAGARLGLPVFPRYDEMRLWAAETGLGLAGLSPDGMHMDDRGYALLGDAVASFVLREAEGI